MKTSGGSIDVGAVVGGKYAVVRLLGEGGMGAVFEAENSWTHRRVAIKVLRAEMAADPVIARRFMQEAQAASRLDHPNVVSVLDMGEDADTGERFIVQEFLKGEDLGALLDRRGVLAVDEALDLILPVMGGLIAAHERGIVHRDIKPENVFLARAASGATVPKIIDFGISKLLGAAARVTSKTRTGTTIGTPAYMSPEQTRGDVDVDARTDIWSVGVMLYRVLAGELPFDAPTYPLLVVKILTESPAPIERLAPAVGPALARAIHRALARDCAQRWPTMRAFVDALFDAHAAATGGPALADRHRLSIPSAPSATPSTPPGALRTGIEDAATLAEHPGRRATAARADDPAAKPRPEPAARQFDPEAETRGPRLASAPRADTPSEARSAPRRPSRGVVAGAALLALVPALAWIALGRSTRATSPGAPTSVAHAEPTGATGPAPAATDAAYPITRLAANTALPAPPDNPAPPPAAAAVDGGPGAARAPLSAEHGHHGPSARPERAPVARPERVAPSAPAAASAPAAGPSPAPAVGTNEAIILR